jgi:hypothetical protein
MVVASIKTSKVHQSIFIKKLDKITKVSIPPSTSRKRAMDLADKGIINQFTGIWPSPNTVDFWLEKNWKPMIKGSLNNYLCGRGFYTFPFKHKEDRDLIFRSSPYFLGARGMYLNKWTLNFSPENDIPFVVLV